MFEFAEAAIILCVSIVTACLALMIPARRSASIDPPSDAAPKEKVALLFDDGFLHHASSQAQDRLSLVPGVHIWTDLRDKLLGQFPELPLDSATGDQGHMSLRAAHPGDFQQVDLEWDGPLAWVTLSDPDGADADPAPNIPQEEIAALRLNSLTSPHPSWQSDGAGRIVWANAAYLALKGRTADPAVQKITTLFDLPDTPGPHRVTLKHEPDGTTDHYSITSRTIDNITACHATRINALVNAENARLTFVQTLTKTFAHLPTGLAIFDRNDQLALFNPALVDLSGLSGAYLSSQPTMLSFFDQLRENRRMPEPRNYMTWRDEIGSLIRAASDNGYQETWTLEDGRTYSVQGRPHPDGATAFLIDDITANIMITRNFRKELEIGQGLLDTIDDAIAVFSRSGVLTLCNASYRDLWDQNPESSFADVTIHDCIRVWRAVTKQPLDGSSIEDFVLSFEDPEPLALPCVQVGNRHFACDLRVVAPGARMVRFKALTQEGAPPNPLPNTQTDPV